MDKSKIDTINYVKEMPINYKSLFIAGLIAGICIVLSAMTMVPVVGNEMDIILAGFGLPPLSIMGMIFFLVMSLLMGIGIVFFYILAKSVMGEGIKTAIIISFILWFFIYFFANGALVVYGFMPIKFAALGTIWGLGELILAGVIGSKLYRDNNAI